MFGGGQLWTLIADARGDVFHVDNNDPVDFPGVPDKSRYVSRGIPYVALAWRWPFIAESSPGHSYIVQPIAQFIAQPYGGNPKGLRIEDSQAFEFSDNNVFSFNQLPGYDVIESGPRANVGARAEALFPGGKVEAQVGQTYRLKPDPLFAALSGNTGTSSDIVGSFSIKFPHLDLTDRIDVDRGNGMVRRHEVYVTGTYDRSSVQISYVQLPQSVTTLGLPSREEVNFQGDVNVWRNWQVFVAAQRDMHAVMRIELELGAGALAAQPTAIGAVLSVRPRAAERLEVGAAQHARHYAAADHVVGKRVGDRARMKQRIAGRIAGRERGRQAALRSPVPIGQREVALAGQLAADAFERKNVGTVPRQEVPVAVRAEIAMDVREASPVARIGCGQSFHRGDAAAVGGEIGIVETQAADCATRACGPLADADPKGAEHRRA